MSESIKPASYQVKTFAEYCRLTERFEKVNDGYILPDINLVIRLDAGRLHPDWEGIPNEAYPFNSRIVEALLAAARASMCVGIAVVYAFIHGDEISLLLHKNESDRLRKRAKLISHLASAAACGFQKYFRAGVVFEAKLSELPTDERVLDYFFWQRSVASRNYFSRTNSILLGRQGLSEKEIGQQLAKLDFAGQTALAEQLGHSLTDVPKSFLHGACCWWESCKEKNSAGEVSSPYQIVQRRQLPAEDQRYLSFLCERLQGPCFVPGRRGEIPPCRSIKPARKRKNRLPNAANRHESPDSVE